MKHPTQTSSPWRAPLLLCLACASLAPAGCVRSRREVMLILTTNIPCPAIDRVAIRLSRGAGSTNYTYQRTFALSGDNCATTSNAMFDPPIPLSTTSEFRLGIVDDRRSDDRLRIEVEALGITGVRTIAETDFVDDKIYAVPMELIGQCVGPETCASGFECRVMPGTSQAGCGSVYRRPGSLGTFASAMSITADEYVEMGP